MTTTINIQACADEAKQVRAALTGQPDIVIPAGGTAQVVIYDSLSLMISEELRPALTEADAEADLAGTPRPDYPSA